jgi:uncharacterized protein YxjI
MDYPLSLTFKILAVARQFSVTDATGNPVLYVRQKPFKLKEAVTVYADEKQTRAVASITADRIIDISSTYRFEDMQGRSFGSLRRGGLKSLWRADYQVLQQDTTLFTIREENVWIKVLDGFLMEIPGLNLLGGYLFHPAYRVNRPDGTTVLRIQKQPAFLEGKFTIERKAVLAEQEEILAVMSLLMVVLLERRRG